MKKVILILLFLVVNKTYSQGFHERNPTVLNEIEKIESTKKYWKEVELDSSELLEHSPSEGAELSGYFLNNKIQKIVCEAFISHGQYENTYYFKNEKLFFVVEKFLQYEYNIEKNEFNYEKSSLSFMGEYLFEPKFDLETLGHDIIREYDIDVFERLKNEAEAYLKKLLAKMLSE